MDNTLHEFETINVGPTHGINEGNRKFNLWALGKMYVNLDSTLGEVGTINVKLQLPILFLGVARLLSNIKVALI